jgi:hypothetical protein
MELNKAMAKRGRKPKPRSEAVWIQEELIDLVKALKADDIMTATIYFAKWVDARNKPNVN